MKLAVSNVGWQPQDRALAYDLLQRRGITGLEIAPGLFFADAADPFRPTAAEADAAVSEMRAAGLELVSMQSLLFGVTGAELFGDAAACGRFRAGLMQAIALAGRFSIPNLVFGSPRQRVVPPGMTPQAAFDRAVDVFRDLGEAAAAAGTRLGIEANPPAYGTNFLNDFRQAQGFVEAVGHPAVTLILDLGTMHMNAEFDRTGEIVAPAVRRISHVHISEPDLAPAPAVPAQAAAVLAMMRRVEYDGWFSVEMKAQPDHLGALASALDRLLAAVAAAQDHERAGLA